MLEHITNVMLYVMLQIVNHCIPKGKFIVTKVYTLSLSHKNFADILTVLIRYIFSSSP